MENKKTIGLLGCGWLGFPLAKGLMSSGFKVKGSTTSPDKLGLLQNAGVDPYLVQFSPSRSSLALAKILDSDILVVSIPPGRRNPEGFNSYRKMVSELCLLLPRSPVTKLILISSTSVYPDINGVVDESSVVSPESESGRLMVESETLLSEAFPGAILLRLAGLIGPDRMPGRFFAGKTGVPDAEAPVNLIHQTDALGLLHSLIGNENASGIYNGCAPSHPGRQEFYTAACEKEDLVPPVFLPGKSKWKIISSKRVKQELDFDYQVGSLMDWLQAD